MHEKEKCFLSIRKKCHVSQNEELGIYFNETASFVTFPKASFEKGTNRTVFYFLAFWHTPTNDPTHGPKIRRQVGPTRSPYTFEWTLFFHRTRGSSYTVYEYCYTATLDPTHTMGRPSLTTAQRRPARGAAIDARPSSSSPGGVTAPEFPRRFPRLGTAFQTKVGQWNSNSNRSAEGVVAYAFDRPLPLPMARNVPHQTAATVAENPSLLYQPVVAASASVAASGMYRVRACLRHCLSGACVCIPRDCASLRLVTMPGSAAIGRCRFKALGRRCRCRN